MAWEFNQSPVLCRDRALAKPASFLQTSDNVIVEALRREGGEIELRLAECLGRAGKASVTLNLPHRDAALTDMLGGYRQSLGGRSGYSSPSARSRLSPCDSGPSELPEVKPLTQWDASFRSTSAKRYVVTYPT